MTENGLFVRGRLGKHMHDILWAVHDGKNHGRSKGEENIGVFSVTVGGRAERCTEVCAFLLYTHARGCEALGSN